MERASAILTALGRVRKLPAELALLFIRAYRATAPIRPPMCRYTPSCSEYTAGCIRAYGLFAGAALGIRRILRCNPFSPGGYDPVPEPQTGPERVL